MHPFGAKPRKTVSATATPRGREVLVTSWMKCRLSDRLLRTHNVETSIEIRSRHDSGLIQRKFHVMNNLSPGSRWNDLLQRDLEDYDQTLNEGLVSLVQKAHEVEGNGPRPPLREGP